MPVFRRQIRVFPNVFFYFVFRMWPPALNVAQRVKYGAVEKYWRQSQPGPKAAPCHFILHCVPGIYFRQAAYPTVLLVDIIFYVTVIFGNGFQFFHVRSWHRISAVLVKGLKYCFLPHVSLHPHSAAILHTILCFASHDTQPIPIFLQADFVTKIFFLLSTIHAQVSRFS